MKQCQKELVMENILFVTIMIEFQDYLMNNEYWDEKNNPLCTKITCNGNERIVLPKTVPMSPIVYQMKKSTHTFVDRVVNVRDNSIRKGYETHLAQQMVPSRSASASTVISSNYNKESVITEGTDCDSGYSQFSNCFDELYVTYIEQNRAPLELNISWKLRGKIQQRWKDMKKAEKKLDATGL